MAKKKETTAKSASDDELVEMSKDGESILVHRTQIAPWAAQGWIVK